MPKGLKASSSLITIGFSSVEGGAGVFNQNRVDLQLNPLDNEVFVVQSVNLDPVSPDAIAGVNTQVNCSVTTTSRAAVAALSDSSCFAQTTLDIRAAGFIDSGVSFTRASLETPPAALEYIAIISTNDFFVQILGTGNLGAKSVNGKLYGYRARADSSVYAALVQSEVLTA